MKETYIQLHDISPHHPNLVGLSFNIIDNSDMLYVHLHNYINDHQLELGSSDDNLRVLGHRGVSATEMVKNAKKTITNDPDNIKIQHMLSRVVEDIVLGDFQLLITVIHNRIDDMIKAYRVPPLRLFIEKDRRSWVKIEQLVEPLVGAEINRDLFDLANRAIPVNDPPASPSFARPSTPVSFSA